MRETLDLLRVNVLIVIIDNANNVLAANFAIANIYFIINNINENNVSTIISLASY